MWRTSCALDFPSFDDVKTFLEHFSQDGKLYVKIGMEIFMLLVQIVHYLEGLDTAFSRFEIAWHSQYGALGYVCLGTFGVNMVTVHAAGGVEMMREAKNVLGDKAN